MLEIADLHKPFEKWLREQGIPFIRARSDQASTIREGWPDFTLLLGGRALCIEFKTEKGKTSAKQQACHAELEATGTKVFVVRDLQVAIDMTNAWRFALGSIQPAPGSSAPAERKPPAKLRRFAGRIWEEGPQGYSPIRAATAADINIPELSTR